MTEALLTIVGISLLGSLTVPAAMFILSKFGLFPKLGAGDAAAGRAP